MNKEQEEHLRELKIIAQTLRNQEGMQLIEPWAFFTWAAVTLAGTIITLLLHQSLDIPGSRLVLAVWVPAVLVGGVFETLGWIRIIKRTDRVLFTDSMQRMILSFTGIITAFLFLGFSLAVRGVDLAGIIVLMMSVSFMALGVFSWKELFMEAYLLLAVGIALLFLSDGGEAAYLIAAGVVTAAFIAGGIHSSRKECSSRR